MVFIETPTFTNQVVRLISDKCYLEMQKVLAQFPAAGDLIRGSNGCRKFRWRVQGQGKRSGIRIIYYWIVADDQILMLAAYAKTRTTDLTRTQIKALGRAVAHELRTR